MRYDNLEKCRCPFSTPCSQSAWLGAREPVEQLHVRTLHAHGMCTCMCLCATPFPTKLLSVARPVRGRVCARVHCVCFSNRAQLLPTIRPATHTNPTRPHPQEVELMAGGSSCIVRPRACRQRRRGVDSRRVSVLEPSVVAKPPSLCESARSPRAQAV